MTNEARLARLEIQVQRIMSDIESEKGTRSRMNDHFDKRMTNVERQLWQIFGGLAMLQIILGVTIALIQLLKK